MKINFKSLLACTVLSCFLFSCQKDSSVKTTDTPAIPSDVLNQIRAQGFSTDGVIAMDGGYIVEGDIYLSHEALSKSANGLDLRVAEEEQYRTTNIIGSLPRRITVSISGLDPIFVTATDSAIRRYNRVQLDNLRFRRVASGGEIQIVGALLPPGVLGSSGGFPDDNGNPPSNPITLSTRAGIFGSNPSVQYITTIIAHEIGHTIGFRHTDYANRNYSCGFSIPKNEGDAGVGAIWIPGTPTGPQDPGSWMLACIGQNVNRPFNTNDLIALNYLYD
jgi:hypothetical protein